MATKQWCNDKDTEYGTYREEFKVPTLGSMGINNHKYGPEVETIYFCGNSLGLMPKSTQRAVQAELDAWGARGVEAHFNHPYRQDEEIKGVDWVDIDLPLVPVMASLVGAKPTEVAIMGTLTMNLNSLLVSFYKPQSTKTKILFEKQAFPSDYYAFLNLVKIHGYDESHLIQLDVKPGETYLSTNDILDAIELHKHELAMVCFPGIQYYTGQYFDIKTITEFAHDREIVVGWDLAHAVGNVVLELHDWNVDFACWCNYKYINSGPGAIAGIFVNEKYTQANAPSHYPPRLAGWWGNNDKDRFKMLEKFDPLQSALSYRQSNPSVLDVVAVKASLSIFQRVGLQQLRQKSIELTNFLEQELHKSPYFNNKQLGFTILTPSDAQQRGCQLSLKFNLGIMEEVFNYLRGYGIICDERRPDVIRLAPVPLYNKFIEVYYVVQRLNQAFDTIGK